METPKQYTVKEAAKLLGISAQVLYILARKKRISFNRVGSGDVRGGRIFFEEAHLEQYRRGNEVRSTDYKRQQVRLVNSPNVTQEVLSSLRHLHARLDRIERLLDGSEQKTNAAIARHDMRVARRIANRIDREAA